MANKKQTVLIVGASRGLGFGLSREFLKRGWHVIATERKNDPQSPLRELYQDHSQDHSADLQIETLDINEPTQIKKLASTLSGQKLDVLFINAGVAEGVTTPIGEVTTDEFMRMMLTNSLSPLRVIEALDDLVTPTGVISAMTSGLGSVSENTNGGYEAYRASKAALNMLLRSYAARAGGSRAVLAMSPGWVKTDMGGPEAPLDLETSCHGMVDTILARQGSTGSQFVDYQNHEVGW